MSMKNGGTWTVWAGRSLSSDQGSLDVPIVNGPPGTGTSAGRLNASAGGAAGGGAASTGGPFRSWWVISIVSSCCCSCCTIMPNAKPSSVSGVPANRARARTSSTRPRTSDAYVRASRGASSGSDGRSDRGCSNAS